MKSFSITAPKASRRELAAKPRRTRRSSALSIIRTLPNATAAMPSGCVLSCSPFKGPRK